MSWAALGFVWGILWRVGEAQVQEGGEGSPCSGQGPSLGAADGRRSWSQAHGPSCQSER